MNKDRLLKQGALEGYKKWLIQNPNHPDYQTVLKDKITLEKQLNEYGLSDDTTKD